MESMIKKFIFLSIIVITLIPFSAQAEYYIVSQGGCCGDCPRFDVVYTCCPNWCSGYFEHHAKRARSHAWAGTSEYAWIPDPADP